MKKITKLTFAIFAFTMLFTACSSDDDAPQPEKIAKEITAEELSDYIIIEEYKPKSSASAASGDKPILVTTYIAYTNQYMLRMAEAWSRYEYTLQTTYDVSTGITSVETYFGYYDLTRDASGQILVIKSRHNNDSQYSITKSFDSQYLQLVKKTQSIYDNTTYKNLTGSGYYRFKRGDNTWRYKENGVPTEIELTWSYSQANNHIWYGQDGGTAKYKNIFIALPKGNGWKGQHKDKDLLLINTVEKDHYKAVGDIGIYEVNN